MARLLKHSATVARLPPSGRASRRSQQLRAGAGTVGLRFPGCAGAGRGTGLQAGSPRAKRHDTGAPRRLGAGRQAPLALPRGAPRRTIQRRRNVAQLVADAEPPAVCSPSRGTEANSSPRLGFSVPCNLADDACGGRGLGNGAQQRSPNGCPVALASEQNRCLSLDFLPVISTLGLDVGPCAS